MKSYLRFFRVFLPSWRFFESINPIPKIHYRTSKDGTGFSEWMELPWTQSLRSIKNLFYNPDVNLDFFYHVQVEQLLIDIADSENSSEVHCEGLASFQIVSCYIKDKIIKNTSEDIVFFQFKIGVYEFSDVKKSNWVEALISPVLEV